MLKYHDGLPESPIKLDGFPLCKVCDREANVRGEGCAQHGGPPLAFEGLRRSILRQLRTAIKQLRQCNRCADKKLNEIRCAWCTWLRGAAMGIAGIGEQMGWESDAVPYMEMIGTYQPGWNDLK